MTRTWAYPPTMTSYGGGYLSIKMLLYIAMTHACASPPTMTSYRGGVPVNQIVTIYSDDTCMGVPPPPLLRHIGGVPANQNVTIYSNDSCRVLLKTM